ncbi:Hypp6123 [Branchiostoma lanceolatum]|uniref:Hypp6123 protein n=1 Tax=Branchiostoma lanceolatum TaxID=7740 RepID=A0A8J9YSD8_BRALA|nr:Hypp6123 [Branchiostoma lanceolatum]
MAIGYLPVALIRLNFQSGQRLIGRYPALHDFIRMDLTGPSGRLPGPLGGTRPPTCSPRKWDEVPNMDGESLEGLGKILKVVQRLSEEEDARLHFIQKWYVDEVCKLAMDEAPEVLGGG